MISDAVQKSCDDFIRDWSLEPSRAPAIQFDKSWPSVGIVDLLLRPLRGAEELAEADMEILHGAAAYLGVMAHECWEAMGAEVELSSDKNGVYIKALSGPALEEEETFIVEIEAMLGAMLQELSTPMPVLTGFDRHVTGEDSLVSLFATGIFLGLSPYGRGPWAEMEKPENFVPFLERSVKVLAKSSASFYGRVFPEEPLGQVAELYLNDLIFPPAGLGEPFLGFKGCAGLIAFFKEFQIGLGAQKSVLERLARVPDDLISRSALTYLVAIIEEPPSPEIIAISQRMGDMLGVCRKSMTAVRDHYGLGQDWLTKDALTDPSDIKRFKLEQRLGATPWIILDANRLKKPDGMALARLLVTFDFEGAVNLVDKMIEDDPGDLEIRLQRLFLDSICMNMEEALSGFRSLITEPGAEEHALLYNQWGLVELSLGDVDSAVRHLGKSFALISGTAVEGQWTEAADVANNYALALIHSEEYEKALEILRSAVAWDDCPLTALLNQSYVLKTIGRYAEGEEIDQTLLDLAPLDSRVYDNLVYSALQAKGLTDLG